MLCYAANTGWFNGLKTKITGYYNPNYVLQAWQI